MTFSPCIDIPGIPAHYAVTSCEESDDVIRVHATAPALAQPCPHCGQRQPSVWGYRSITLLDMPRRKKRVEIVVKARRLHCKNKDACGRIFGQELPGMIHHHHMTSRLYRWIGEQGRVRPFVDIARDLKVVEATVRDVFGDCMRDIERAVRIGAPAVLALVNLRVHKAQRVAAVNTELQTLVGLADKEDAAALSTYLAGMFDREKVLFVSLGPSSPALQAVAQALPHATAFLDKPHVLGLVNTAVNQVRLAVRRYASSYERKLLAGDAQILALAPDAMTAEQVATVAGWRARFAPLDEALRAAEGIHGLYRPEAGIRDGRDLAEQLAAVMNPLGALCAASFKPMAVTLEQWNAPWASYFAHDEARAGGLKSLEDVLALGPVLEGLGRTHSFGAVRSIILLPPAVPAYSYSTGGASIARLLEERKDK